jgi:hypothetical protein
MLAKIYRPIATFGVLSTLFCGATVQAAETIFDLSVGPRLDEFRWSVAGNSVGQNPNVLSELTWSDIESVQLNASADTTFGADFRLQGMLSYGSIHNGQVQDSDYFGNNRTNEVSRAVADSDGDDLMDINLSFGKRFVVTDAESTTITPLVGISYHTQDFVITNGKQQIDTLGGTAGQPLSGLNSTYETEWWSTYLGFQIDHQGKAWDVYGRVEYHSIDFKGEADWNLRADYAHPRSFKQEADGSGPTYLIGARYQFNPNWSFSANVKWWNWDSDNGDSTTYLANGQTIGTHLNTAQWEGRSVLLGVTFEPTK